MILQRPDDAWALYVLAHGAGAGMRHPFMQRLADELSGLGIATLRYEFPYMAARSKRIDPKPVLEATVRDAVAEAAKQRLPLFAGGKSMGGRMTSQAQAREPLALVRGIAFVGFPLHPPRRPGVERAEHLSAVRLPMLFLQGARDALADLQLLRPIVERLPGATLEVIEGADHSFRAAKRDLAPDLARLFARWARPLAGDQR